MTTPLHSTLKRALSIDGRDYVVTLTETVLKLTLKGKRNGVELSWAQLVNGEAALAVALHASLGAFAAKDKTPARCAAAGKRRLPPTGQRKTETRFARGAQEIAAFRGADPRSVMQPRSALQKKECPWHSSAPSGRAQSLEVESAPGSSLANQPCARAFRVLIIVPRAR